MTSESSKQKIGKIHDVFPNATKDHIAKILQYYDEDENEAMDALTRDGGMEALSSFADSGSIKSKNNKNKKKKKKGRKETDVVGSTTASFDADDSSSLHSSGNVDAEVEKENSVLENRNGIQYSVTVTEEASCERLSLPEVESSNSTSKDCVPSKNDLVNEHPDNDTSAPNPVCISPVSDSSDKQDDSKKEKHRSTKEDSYGKHSSRQRTSSLRRSKTSSLSEDSTNAHNPQNTAVPTKRGYEKCKKDLNRQSISLQRIHTQVVKGLEESSKKLKNSFNELRKLLDKRQETLEQELEKTKDEALNLLKSRQDLAVDLKKRVDRTLTEAEWSELRLDVKQFVTERKYDDELGKTIWYHWSVDAITELINTFGEVQPVKNVYSQRSHSALGNAIIPQSNPEQPSPSSSPANEETNSAADKNFVADLLDEDHVEEETPVITKDVVPPAPRTQPIENRARIFSNRKFQNASRGNKDYRGGGRGGNRGYGNPRGNNRGNMGYRNNNYYDYSNNYRNHSHQDRDNRVHDNTAYSNDRGMNSYRGNRGDRRGGQGQGQYRGGRYRGNMNQQRQHMDNVVKTESTSNVSATTAAADSDKPTVVNGFVNN